MFYLFLAILCSSTIAFLFKIAEKRGMDSYTITSANYFTASVISLCMILNQKLWLGVVKEQSFMSEWQAVLTSTQDHLSSYNSIVWGLLVGGLAGFFFFYSFLYYQKSVQKNGIALSGTFSKLGILIPLIFSIVLWQEFPTRIQWVGIVLSLISIVMVNVSLESLKKFSWNKTIILLFFFGGLAEFSNKIYQQYALSTYKDIFLLAVFSSAFLISIIHLRKHNQQREVRDVLMGVAVGIPNLFSSYFLLLSLNTLSASIVFPTFSAGSIAFINLGGFIFFKEKVSRKNQLAISLVVIALILMNR